MWEGGTGARTGASSWEEAEDRGRRMALWKQGGKTNKNETALPGASSGKIKVGCQLPDPVFSVHFLQFHPAVLKPDFNLSVREVDAAADLEAPLSSKVHVEQKLLLQLQRLVLRVGAALLPAALCREPVGCVFAFGIAWHFKGIKGGG